MAIDVQTLLDSVDIVDVIGRYIRLDKAGKEYTALCPFHTEDTPSFTVSPAKQFYHCFGCGAHGDAIRFVQEYRGLGFRDACAEIADGQPPESVAPPQPRAPRKPKEEAAEWQPVIPVPADAPPRKKTYAKSIKGKWIPGEFVADWPYRLQDGSLAGYAQRFEWAGKDGKEKDVVPLTYCRNVKTGAYDWRNLAMPKPRPLYQLDRLAANPGAVVIVCEGEKAADAAGRLLPSAVATTWPGGSQAIKHASWDALRGRRVILWPDADDVGMRAMDGFDDPRTGERKPGVADLLQGIADAVRVVMPPEGVSDGWDLADAEAEGWTTERLLAHIEQYARAPSCEQPRNEHEPPPELPDDIPDDLPGGDLDDEPPYRPLGYDHGRYYYLAGRAAQVIELSSSAHTKLNLLSIAPLAFWNRTYPPGKDSDGASWEMAANALMRQCENVGVFDPEKVRGRGAWWDEGRALLHVGDALIVDGERRPLTYGGVRYIYEAGAPLSIDMHDPLTAKDAHGLVEICKMLPWEKPISGLLLAGWMFLAPICGALSWRPHIWITGGAGTGKSWVHTYILKPVTGNAAIHPLGGATEAGIRQLLGMDARPVIFDEAEGEDAQAQARIQGIMALARQASSETGGTIIKGTAGGRANTYRIRSMFAFLSIGVGVQQYADKTRISVLGMHVDTSKSAEERAAHFASLRARAESLLTEEYCARLRARAVNMIGAIRENARIFAAAGASVIGTQRLGDQIGTLLAGAYALHKNGIITPEDARDWIARQDWSEETALTEAKDEQACLARIIETVVRVTGAQATVERNIGELIAIAVGRGGYSDGITQTDASEQLLRMGIKIVDGGFIVSNGHSAIERILSGTPWAKNWGRILKRLPGAQAREPQRFGAGGAHRGVWLPAATVTGDR